MTKRIGRVLAIAALLALATPASAQTDALQIGGVEDEDYPTVELTVTVPSQLGDVALPADAFEVSENGESRGRPSLGQSGDPTTPPAPRTVLAIDTSGSMSDDIGSAQAAAAEFVNALRPGSEIAVVTFGDRPNVITEFTSDIDATLDDIASITVNDDAKTALYDGVRRANRLLSRGRNDVPQSIVVLSDGVDSSSSNGALDKAIADLAASSVTVWAVILETGDSNREALATLAGSPDRVLSAADAGELESIYSSIASDVSRQYLLRYASEADGDTRVTIDVSFGTVSSSNSVETTIDATSAPDATVDVTRIAAPDPFTVSVPLLGTTGAYLGGLGAIAVAVVLLTWVLMAKPAVTTGRDRLIPAPSLQQRPGLNVVAEWVTAQADRRLRGRRLGGSVDQALEGAGLNMRTGEFVVGVMSMMVVAYTVGLLLANSALGLLLAVMVPIAARLLLSIRRDKRQAAFAEQFIDVLQLLAGSLRAGHGLLQGIDAVSRDSQDPAASEFRRILIEHRLGRDLTEAMDNCAVRMGNDDFRWVVQAIGIHREVGGDLARVLDNIVGTVRERTGVYRQIRALSAEGRMSAWVLTALPLVTMAIISLVSPSYLGELTSRPIGVLLLGIAGTMLLMGTFVIRRMVKIRY